MQPKPFLTVSKVNFRNDLEDLGKIILLQNSDLKKKGTRLTETDLNHSKM